MLPSSRRIHEKLKPDTLDNSYMKNLVTIITCNFLYPFYFGDDTCTAYM